MALHFEILHKVFLSAIYIYIIDATRCQLLCHIESFYQHSILLYFDSLCHFHLQQVEDYLTLLIAYFQDKTNDSIMFLLVFSEYP